MLLAASGSVALAQQYSISTIAGGVPPLTPAPAAGASIGRPQRVVAGASGQVYFSSGNSVFEIGSSGALTLVAGTSRAGFSGDGGPAASAQLNQPKGLALDVSGNLYIADSGNNRIRMVSNGTIATIAGSGVQGYSGDGGQATAAQLYLPSGVAVQSTVVSDGTVYNYIYIADTVNHAIRRIAYDGSISTITGDGDPGYTGDAGAASGGTLTAPEDVALDSAGNLYIADTGNNVIREVSTAFVISTIAGNGTNPADGETATNATINEPISITVDSSGNYYFAEYGTNKVREVTVKGIISTVTGNGALGYSGDGGTAVSAVLSGATGVAVNASGNLYIADTGNNRIREVSSGNIATVAGNGFFSYSGDGAAAAIAQLNAPRGEALDALGNLYFADTGNNRVREISANGVITTVAGTGVAGYSGDGGAAAGAQVNQPYGVAVDAAGNVYIADTSNHSIRRVAPNGNINTIAGNGSPGYSGDGGAASAAQLNGPTGICADASGNLYIADLSNGRVRKISTAGVITTVAGNGGIGYSGDGGPAVNATLYHPYSVAVDAAGNLYIADSANNRIREVTLDGNIATVAGNGSIGYLGDGGPATSAELSGAAAVAVDMAGNLYIADASARIREVSPDGTINTIAGTGIPGYSGDGGMATSAQLNSPSGIAISAAGNLYVSDAGESAVRLLQPSGYQTVINAVTNGASNLVGPVAPGEVAVLYGSGLGPATLAQFQLDSNGLVPGSLAGARVLFNGIPAPVLYASADQVGVVVPYGVTGSRATVVAQYQEQTSAPVTLTVAQSAPALFTLGSSGAGQAAAINADGTVNTAGNPAKIGSYVSLYATGGGETSPAGVDGSVASASPPKPVLPVSVTVGGRVAQVQYAGGAPGLVAGVMQINVQIPSGISSGSAVPVMVNVGSALSQAGVTLAVTGN
jgi:uncharacterized protein (TIGR03437 family)